MLQTTDRWTDDNIKKNHSHINCCIWQVAGWDNRAQ